MTETTDATDAGRTETKRFDADDAPFDLNDAIEGDRISPALVANTMAALGTTRAAGRDSPDTQLAEATITDRYDDTHRAVLVDGETGRMAVASRHDSQSAWTQKEADWKIRELGTKVSVTDADLMQDGDSEFEDADIADEAEAWANVVLQDRARGSADYADELELSGGSHLTLYEPHAPTKIVAEFELTDA